MSKNRLFNGTPTRRLIISIEAGTVDKIDQLIGYGSGHPAQGNRAEFIRQAIEQELARHSRTFDD